MSNEKKTEKSLNEEKPEIKTELTEEKEEFTELDAFEQLDSGEVLLSDFDHKSSLLNIKIKKKLENLDDTLVKGYQLGRLTRRQANILSFQVKTAMLLIKCGFPNEARIELSEVMSDVIFSKSIGGFERMLQTNVANLFAEIGKMQEESQQMMSADAPQTKGLLSGIGDKIRGR